MKKRLIIILCLLGLSGITLLGAISLDLGDAFITGSTSVATHTFSGFTVGNDSNGLLVSSIHYDCNAATVDTFTFNGDALTSRRADNQGTENSHTEIWSRISPDVATGDIVATLSGPCDGGITGISLFGVDQTTPIGDTDGETGTTTTSTSLTLTTTSGDWVISCVTVRDGNSQPGGALVPTDGTEIEEMEIVGATLRGSCLYKVATGSSTSVGWSWTASTGWSHSAVVVQQVAAAGGIGLPIILSSRRRH